MYKIKSAISLSIAFIILSGIVTNVLTFDVNGHNANALSTTNSSLSSSPNTLSNDNINNSSSSSSSSSSANINNNTVANVSKQYQQQLSSAPHTREYTL